MQIGNFGLLDSKLFCLALCVELVYSLEYNIRDIEWVIENMEKYGKGVK